MEWSEIDNREDEGYIGVERDNSNKYFFAEYPPPSEISNAKAIQPVDISNFIHNNKTEEIINNEDDLSDYYDYFSLVPKNKEAKPKTLFQVFRYKYKLSSVSTSDSINNNTRLLSTDLSNINSINADISTSSTINTSPQIKKEEQVIEDEQLIPSNNNDYAFFIANLSHKERIRLKREKTKNMLKQKTERNKLLDNLYNNNNNVIKETNPFIFNQNCVNVYKHSTLNINDNDINININETNGQTESNNSNNNNSNNVKENLTKKEIKMLRNRFSAQQSRDRKKKEFDELKMLTHNLIEENSSLKSQLQSSEKKIQLYEKVIKQMCPTYLDSINSELNMVNNNSNNNTTMNMHPKKYLSPLTNNSQIKKRNLTLFTGLFTMFCVFSSLLCSSSQSSSSPSNVFKNPLLAEIKHDINNDVQMSETDHTENFESTSSNSTSIVNRTEIRNLKSELESGIHSINTNNHKKLKPLFCVTHLDLNKNTILVDSQDNTNKLKDSLFHKLSLSKQYDNNINNK